MECSLKCNVENIYFCPFAVPLELPILKREYFNRWYKLRSYYLAGKLADFLIQLISTFIYTVIVYYMSDQLPESRRFGLYMLMCFVVSLVGQTAGLIMGCALKVQVCINLFYYSNYIKFIYINDYKSSFIFLFFQQVEKSMIEKI